MTTEQLPGTHNFLSGDGNAVQAEEVPVLEEPMPDVVPEQFGNFALDPNDPLSKELEGIMGEGVMPPQTVQPQQDQVDSSQQATQTQLTADERRYQHWQREYDLKNNQYNQLNEEYERVKPYLPLVKAIEANPNLLDVLETAPKGETIEAPVQPQPPVGYNLEEADERGTESYNYRMELEDWRNKTINYQNKLIENMQTQQEEMRQNERQHQQDITAKKELQNNLMNQYGLPADIADDFVREMSAPQSRNEANLIRLYYLNHPDKRQQMLPAIQRLNMLNQGLPNQQLPNQQYMEPNQVNTPQNRQQLAERINQMQNRNIPPSVVLGQGANPPQLSEEQKFNQGLLQTKEVDY